MRYSEGRGKLRSSQSLDLLKITRWRIGTRNIFICRANLLTGSIETHLIATSQKLKETT